MSRTSTTRFLIKTRFFFFPTQRNMLVSVNQNILCQMQALLPSWDLTCLCFW